MNDTALAVLAESAPVSTHFNPPGQPQLSYRAGTYATVLQRLVGYILTHTDPNSATPLLRLDVDPYENWAVGLLQAWAMVIDVLTFYQERIANEGYLRTATERRSVLELVRAIGYELRPGVSATAYLAFTVRAGQDTLIPRGVAVQSVPTQGQHVLALPGARPYPRPSGPGSPQLPQIFETSADFTAHAAWNAIPLAADGGASGWSFQVGTRSLRLDGAKTGLRAGDTILITSATDPPAGQERSWVCATLSTVAADAQKGYTLVAWEANGALTALNSQSAIPNPVVFALRQQAKLYTYPQSGIHYSPSDTADWTPSSIGLPSTAVNALVVHTTGDLFVATDDGMFRSSNQGETWEAASSGLPKTKIQALTVAPDGRLYAGSSAGALFTSIDNGNNWRLVVGAPRLATGIWALLPLRQPPNTALPKTVIRSLTTYTASNQTYLVAGLDSGAYVSTDDGITWKPVPADKPGRGAKPRGPAWAFAAPAPDRELLIAMTGGVFPFERRPWRAWRNTSFVALIVALILLALDFLLTPAPPSIVPAGGLADTAFLTPESTYPLFSAFNPFVRPLLIAVAALMALIFLLTWWFDRKIQAQTWRSPAPVRALELHAGQLFAGTSAGIFRSTDGGHHWEQMPPPVPRPFGAGIADIRALASVSPLPSEGRGAGGGRSAPVLFAGTHDGAILRSADDGTSWADFSHHLDLANVHGLAAGDGGLFAVGKATSADADSQWSRFQLRNGQLDLDKSYPEIAPGSWLVLRQDHRAVLLRALAVSTGPNQDYRKRGDLTHVRVDQNGQLGAFDRRQAVILAQSEPLPLFDDEPIQGTDLTLDQFVPALEPGHQLIVSGQRPRLRVLVVPAGSVGGLWLVSPDGLRRKPFPTDEAPVILAPPVTTAAGDVTWLLRDRSGFVGTTEFVYSGGSAGATSYEPAQEDDEVVSERVVIGAVRQGTQTALTLQAPLTNVYDRPTVTVYGNVVQATHGQTIANEVVGDVNWGVGSQRFKLKQKPLSYTSVADAANDRPSSLSVLVNQIPWHQVATFRELRSAQRAYLVRQDSQGATSLLFENAVLGARRTNETQQITASYRVGSGAAGNVPANSLTVLRTRPAGVQKVTNPFPASGGADPEHQDMARVNAPLDLQTMQRIISLTDYENFVRTLPGVSKVQARALADGRRRLLLLTVAGDNGQAIAPDSALYDGLLAAIRGASPTPHPLVRLVSFEPRYFQLQATLVISPPRALQEEAIVTNVAQALTAAFGFDKRDLGQSVSASEVIAVMQGVDGVVAVELERLYIKDTLPGTAPNPLLPAQPGRLEHGAPRPAQLLLIDAAGAQGIDLRVGDN
jgi:hypothetical protein